jgi:hypothetical protein
MKFIGILISGFFVLTIAFIATADEIKTVKIGDAVVVYNYQSVGDNGVTLTLNALVTETNDSLRGLKNTDQRRLRKLGELIYQCKLLLYRSSKDDRIVDANSPILISRNYSLFTGVDLSLTANERVGIQARTLQTVDEDSLFTPTLGDKNIHRKTWGNMGGGVAINLKQLNVNVLTEGDLIKTAENMDIIVRFPIFQVEKPVQQWSYNFNLKDFKQAVQHADENCTPVKFMELINQTAIGAKIQTNPSS